MKENIKEVAYVFLSGFIIGIGCALVCMPPAEKETEPLFEMETPSNEELDKEMREFIGYISDKYHLYKIRISIEEEK